MTFNNTTMDEILLRISAMQEQEEKTTRCHDYFPSHQQVDETCRQAMVDWCFKVADALSLSRETVGIAMSFLDRYLSSGNGKSSEALEDKHKFQLAAITAFYTAVKVYEPIQLSVDTLVKLCRGFYLDSEIIEMEQDILFSLEWRISGPTPLDFVRHLLELLPESVNSSALEIILQNAEGHVDHATNDIYFSSCRPSVVGVCCLATSLNETNVLSSSEQIDFWLQISKQLNVDISSEEVLAAHQRILSQSSFSSPISCLQKPALSRSNSAVSSYNANGEVSSPVCVSSYNCQ